MIDGIPNRPLYFYQKDIIGCLFSLGGSLGDYRPRRSPLPCGGEILCGGVQGSSTEFQEVMKVIKLSNYLLHYNMWLSLIYIYIIINIHVTLGWYMYIRLFCPRFFPVSVTLMLDTLRGEPIDKRSHHQRWSWFESEPNCGGRFPEARRWFEADSQGSRWESRWR